MLKWWNAPPKTDAAKKRSEKQMARMKWETLRARDEKSAAGRDAALGSATTRRRPPKPSPWDPGSSAGRAKAGPVRHMTPEEISAAYKIIP